MLMYIHFFCFFSGRVNKVGDRVISTAWIKAPNETYGTTVVKTLTRILSVAAGADHDAWVGPLTCGLLNLDTNQGGWTIWPTGEQSNNHSLSKSDTNERMIPGDGDRLQRREGIWAWAAAAANVMARLPFPLPITLWGNIYTSHLDWHSESKSPSCSIICDLWECGVAAPCGKEMDDNDNGESRFKQMWNIDEWAQLSLYWSTSSALVLYTTWAESTPSFLKGSS